MFNFEYKEKNYVVDNLENVVVNAAILPAFKFMGLDPLLKC